MHSLLSTQFNISKQQLTDTLRFCLENLFPVAFPLLMFILGNKNNYNKYNFKDLISDLDIICNNIMYQHITSCIFYIINVNKILN